MVAVQTNNHVTGVARWGYEVRFRVLGLQNCDNQGLAADTHAFGHFADVQVAGLTTVGLRYIRWHHSRYIKPLELGF